MLLTSTLYALCKMNLIINTGKIQFQENNYYPQVYIYECLYFYIMYTRIFHVHVNFNLQEYKSEEEYTVKYSIMC